MLKLVSEQYFKFTQSITAGQGRPRSIKGRSRSRKVDQKSTIVDQNKDVSTHFFYKNHTFFAEPRDSYNFCVLSLEWFLNLKFLK